MAQLQTAQQTNRLDFLFEAGYSMLSTCPELSRYYMNEFQNSLTEYELNVPKPIQRSMCSRCGQIQVSGLTQRVRLVKKTKILTICLACQEQKKYHGTFKNHLKQKKANSKTLNEPVTVNNDNKKNIPIANNTHKKIDTNIKPIQQQQQPTIKKKNKGKKNNLQAMLNKQQQQQKPANNSLNDFLSSL